MHADALNGPSSLPATQDGLVSSWRLSSEVGQQSAIDIARGRQKGGGGVER